MPAPKPKSSPLEDVRYIPLSYNNAESQKSALRLCLSLFPDWEKSEGPIEFIRFKDGITNTLLKAVKKRPQYTEEQIDKESVLIRAYGNGTEVLIDRERELTAHTLLAHNGLASPLLARFQNGLIYKFVRGYACSPEDLTREAVWRGVARRLADWHALLPIASGPEAAIVQDGMEISLGSSPPTMTPAKDTISDITSKKPTPNVWTVMAKWVLALPATSATEMEQKELLQRELQRTASELADTPGLGGNGLIFGHCDLLSGNVIVKPSEAPSKATSGSRAEPVDFIDYEYATPSPVAFDLANHFSEWGGFECDYSVLPTRGTRRAFIEEYVASYAKSSPLPDESQEFYSSRLSQEVDRFRGVPGLYWGIWALIQSTISHIDFDYPLYAQKRLKEYFDWRATEDGNQKNGHAVKSLREQRWLED